MEERGYIIEAEEEENPDRSSTVFYNTEMEINRDISFLAGKVFSKKIDPEVFNTCDALSGSGIRAYRYTEFSDRVVANDSKTEAAEAIEKGALENDLEIKVRNGDANVLLSENWSGFHYIDLDPFGSFVSFLDSAARALNYQSVLGVTATDKAVPAGAYTKTCRRRYSSRPIKESFMHETGIRIYIKKICEILHQYDKSFDPKICFSDRHYTRIIGRVTESKQRCNNNLEKIGCLSFCRECRWREFDSVEQCGNCGSTSVQTAGPMWTHKLQDQRFIGEALEECPEEWNKTFEMLERLESESELVKPFYDVHELCSCMGIDVPKKDEVLEGIREKGYPVSETHFSHTGFRTDAPLEQIKEIIRENR